MSAEPELERALVDMLKKVTLLHDRRAVALMDGKAPPAILDRDYLALVAPVVKLLAAAR